MTHKDLSEDRGVTLNRLLEEQYSLNMRLLLAIQLRDQEAQEQLRAELEELAGRIERLSSGTRQVFPQ